MENKETGLPIAENDSELEDVSGGMGGGHIDHVICCMCGKEVYYSYYAYNIRINICPFCNRPLRR